MTLIYVVLGIVGVVVIMVLAEKLDELGDRFGSEEYDKGFREGWAQAGGECTVGTFGGRSRSYPKCRFGWSKMWDDDGIRKYTTYEGWEAAGFPFPDEEGANELRT